MVIRGRIVSRSAYFLHYLMKYYSTIVSRSTYVLQRIFGVKHPLRKARYKRLTQRQNNSPQIAQAASTGGGGTGRGKQRCQLVNCACGERERGGTLPVMVGTTARYGPTRVSRISLRTSARTQHAHHKSTCAHQQIYISMHEHTHKRN